MANEVTYKVNLPDGRYIEVIGPPGKEQEAIQKAKNYIAKEGVAEIIEEEDFDYQTGIQNKFLRAQLDMAENIEEKEAVLQRYAGSNGFIRDTRGNIAITPIGQQRLVSKRMLDKDNLSDKNIIIDEEGFSFSDFADFGGTVGPLAGALVALSPHGRLMKFMQPFFKSQRLPRVAAAAIGTGGGQLGEEVFETVQGLQRESVGEVAGDVLMEAGIGGLSQGLFEGGGAALHALLGRKPAIPGDIDIARAIASGADPAEVEALKNTLGRMPTYKDIKKAQADGTIKFIGEEAAVSQRALGRAIPGRLQAASETVFGRTERDNRLIKYGNQRMQKFLEDLQDETLDLQAVGTAFKTGQLTKGQVNELIEEMSNKAAKTNQDVDAYVKNAIEQIDDGAFSLKPDRIGIGQKIRDDLKEIYESQFGITKDEFGNEIAVGTFVQRSRDIDNFLAANNLDAINGKINISLDRLSVEVANLIKRNPYLENLSALEQVPSNPVAALQRILKNYKDQGMSIEALNEIRGSILAVKRASGVESEKLGLALGKVEREINNIFSRLERGGDFASLGLKATGKLEPEGVVRAKGRPSKGQLEAEQKLAKEQAAENMSSAVRMIKEYNADYRNAIKPFNSVEIAKIRKEAAINSYDVDDIYKHVIKKDFPTALNRVLNALDNSSKAEVKAELQKNVLREAVANSVDDFGAINPVSFAKFINDKLGSTKNVLFDNVPNLEVALSDFAKINTKLDAKKFANIVDKLQTKDFSNVVRKLVDAENAKHVIETDKLLKRIVSAEPDEIVSTLFRNGQSGNITKIKEVVDKDTFQKIQQESMRDLLNVAVGPGKTVDEVFNASALERALNAKGDNVLREMFGQEQTQALRNLVRDLRVMTAAEGGGAGTLIAGAVAVNAFNISMLPTLVQLGVMGSVLRNPSVVRRLAKSDKESVNVVMQAFKDSLRLFPSTQLAREVIDVGGQVQEEVENIASDAIEDINLGDITEEVSKEIQTIERPRLTSSLDLPKVEPIATQTSGILSPSLLGTSPANIDIAQRLSNIA